MIKIFEEYNLKNINDWQGITNSHHDEFNMKYPFDEFTDEEYSNILKLFTGARVERGGSDIFINNITNNMLLSIMKYQDDWYVVYYYDNLESEDSIYLCDQFYNMIKCINYLISLNPEIKVESYKWIKKFEEYNLNSYEEITTIDAISIGRKLKIDNFTDVEFDKIISHLGGIKYFKNSYKLKFNRIDNGIIYWCPVEGWDKTNYSNIITKLEDGWFLFYSYNKKNNHSNYYKCDQIDGLLECLSDLNKYKYINESNDVSGYYYKLKSHPALSEEMPLYDEDKLEVLRGYLFRRYGMKYQIIKLHESGYSWNHGSKIYDCVRLMNESLFIRLNDIEVYIYDDDWYIVEFLDTKVNDILYYKCDQIDGLTRFLDDYIDAGIWRGY